MKKLVLAASLVGLAFSSSLALAQATTTPTGKQIPQAAPRAINNQTAVGCNFCFTCGGDWPVFAGSIRSVGDTPIERGSGCSGALTTRADSSPFLCCR